jgi:ribosomal-protein-alanine N-acetyltransferase
MNKIETERLFLRNYKKEEKEYFASLVTDEKIMKFVGEGVLSGEETKNLWNKLIEDFYPQGIDTIWAVFAKDDSRYIGHAALRPRPAKKEDWEISYMLREAEWKKGFAGEIAKKLVEYGFSELNLTEIFATVDDENFPSRRVLEKSGMTFKEFDYDDDGRYSVYSIKGQNTER